MRVDIPFVVLPHLLPSWCNRELLSILKQCLALVFTFSVYFLIIVCSIVLPIFTLLEMVSNWMFSFAPCFFAKHSICENNSWIIHVKYSWPLNNPGLNCVGPLIRGFIFQLTCAVQLTLVVQTQVVQRSASLLGILMWRSDGSYAQILDCTGDWRA